MNTKIIIATMLVSSVVVTAKANTSLNDAFVSLYGLMGATNISQSAFMEDVMDGGGDWYPCFLAARANISEQAMCNWFCVLAEASVPTNSAYSDMNTQLRTKAIAICNIGTNDTVVCGDTNCWLAVARECGRIRSGLHTDEELDLTRGVISRNVDTNGMVFISVSNISDDTIRQRFAQANDIEQKELLYRDFVSCIKTAFPVFLASGTIDALSPSERNSIVSNIVNTASFTPDEAAFLGLTNVIETTSN